MYSNYTSCEALELGKLPRGAVSQLALDLITDAAGLPVRIPVLVARGKQDGPTLGITAAIHGDELNGIMVIHNLFHDHLKLEQLRGTVIGIPVANMPAFENQSRFYPDGFDLNRIMPGRSDGNRSEVYAHRFVERVLPHFDYLVDCHTASMGRINSLYLRVNMHVKVNRTHAHLLNPQVIVHNEAKDGTLRDAAETMGIPSITLEVGNPVRFQYQLIETSVFGLQRLLNQLDMQPLPENFEGVAPQPPVFCKRSYWVYTEEGGLLEVFPGLVERVKKGQLIAQVSNLYGETVEQYHAPEDGIVVGKSVNPVGPAGARIIHLGIEGRIKPGEGAPSVDD